MHRIHYQTIISSPVGPIGIACEKNILKRIAILPNDTPLAHTDHALANTVATALTQYFVDPKYPLTFPWHSTGTVFQQTVWQALQNIPSGSVLTYGELAAKLQTGPRAIGQACRTNPLLIVVPCHRIVAHNGLGGFAGTKTGDWIRTKTWLLQHEGFSI